MNEAAKKEINREDQSEALRYDDLVKVIVVGDRIALIPKDSLRPRDSLPIPEVTWSAFLADNWDFFNNGYHLAFREGWI